MSSNVFWRIFLIVTQVLLLAASISCVYRGETEMGLLFVILLTVNDVAFRLMKVENKVRNLGKGDEQ